MSKLLFSVRDNVAQGFFPPFVAANEAEAKRMVSQMVNSPGNLVSQNPSDFCLYNLGTYDPATGQIAQNGIDLVCYCETLVVPTTPTLENDNG